MTVPPVRRSDLVFGRQRFADADGHGFLTGIHVGQARHLRRQVKLVGVVLEGTDAHHLRVHAQILFRVVFLFLRSAHLVVP